MSNGHVPSPTFSGFMNKVEKHMASIGSVSTPRENVSSDRAIEFIEMQSKALAEAQRREHDLQEIITSMLKKLEKKTRTLDERLLKVEEQQMLMKNQGDTVSTHNERLELFTSSDAQTTLKAGSASAPTTPRRRAFHVEDAIGAVAERTAALMQADMLLTGELRKQQADLVTIQEMLQLVMKKDKKDPSAFRSDEISVLDKRLQLVERTQKQHQITDSSLVKAEIDRIEEQLRRSVGSIHAAIESRVVEKLVAREFSLPSTFGTGGPTRTEVERAARKSVEDECGQLEEHLVKMLEVHRQQVRLAFEVLTERVEARLIHELDSMRDTIQKDFEVFTKGGFFPIRHPVEVPPPRKPLSSDFDLGPPPSFHLPQSVARRTLDSRSDASGSTARGQRPRPTAAPTEADNTLRMVQPPVIPMVREHFEAATSYLEKVARQASMS